MLAITKVYEQHYDKVYSHIEQIKDRIASLSNAYKCCIVRGKETKAVEFCAKANKL